MENVNNILLNDKKPLLKDEFKFIFPQFRYDEYLHNFYARKLSLLFRHNGNKKWFRERYFDKKKEENFADNYNRFVSFINDYGISKTYDDSIQLEEGNFYFLFSLPENISREEIIASAETIKPKKHVIIQNDNIKMYSRTAIFIFDDEDLANNAFDEIQRNYQLTDMEVKNAAAFKKRCTHHIIDESDFDHLVVLLEYLNKMHKTHYVIPENTTDKLLYGIYLLRFTFHYCFYCFKKYDNETQFFVNCGDFHTYSFIKNEKDKKVFDRNFSFLSYKYEKITKFSIENLLYGKYITYEGRTICQICKVEMNSDKNLWLDHFENKHRDDYADILVGLSDSKIFLSQLDIFAIEIINNSNNKRQVPDLMKNFNRHNVRYDLPFIFNEL